MITYVIIPPMSSATAIFVPALSSILLLPYIMLANKVIFAIQDKLLFTRQNQVLPLFWFSSVSTLLDDVNSCGKTSLLDMT